MQFLSAIELLDISYSLNHAWLQRPAKVTVQIHINIFKSCETYWWHHYFIAETDVLGYFSFNVVVDFRFLQNKH